MNIFFIVLFLYKSVVQIPMKDFVRFKSAFAQELYETEIERIQLTKLLKDTKKPFFFSYLLSLDGSKTYTETSENKETM